MRERPHNKEPDQLIPKWWERLATSKISPGALFGRSNAIIAREIKDLFSSRKEIDLEKVGLFIESRRMLLNHVAIADVLNRLSDGFIEGGESRHAEFRRVGVTLVKEFLSSRIRPGPREVATVWRAVGYLDIGEHDCLEELSRRVKRLRGAFEPIDFAFAISGMASVSNRTKEVKDVLLSCCAHFRGVASESPSEALVAVVRSLCRGRCVDGELIDEVAHTLIDRDRRGVMSSTRDSIGFVAYAFRSCAFLRHENAQLSEYTSQRFADVVSQPRESWRDLLSVEAVGDFLWGSAVSSISVPRDIVQALEGYLHEQLRHVSHSKKRYIFATTAMPALMLLGAPPSPATTGAFQGFESEPSPARPESSIEREVARALTVDLNIKFQREFPLGPYRFDFLIERRGGRVIDLEVDGDFHHHVYDINTGETTHQRKGSDVLRDLLVSSCDIEVVRILGSEWAAARDKSQLLREKLRL